MERAALRVEKPSALRNRIAMESILRWSYFRFICAVMILGELKVRRLRLWGSLFLAFGLLSLGFSNVSVAEAAPTSGTRLLTVIDNKSSNNNGTVPVVTNGTLKTSLNAGAQSGRSEVMWGDDQEQRLYFLEGDRVVVDFDVLPGTCGPNGALPPDRSTWHVVYQLIGPGKDNKWSSGPPVTLVWERGLWFVRNGYAVMQADGTVAKLGSQAPQTPVAPCGKWQHWRFDQVLAGPGQGVINAWLDGTHVVDNFKPTAGTFYSQSGVHSHLAL